jgi:menaquinone-dependent protoporphyrinogen oxidase
MTNTQISRRRFLLIAGGAVGAAALTCTGLAGAGMDQAEIQFVETTFGKENPMNDKILVTYASRAGSTVGVAEAIGRALAESGAQVDVRPMKEVIDIATYRAVIAGSAIRGGKWLPEAMQFMRTHQAELVRKPFAAFMVCITLAMKGGEQYREGIANWMSPVRALVKPVSEGLFAGALDCSKLALFDGLQMRAAIAAGVFPAGDHRDWNAIHSWAVDISKLLNK